MKKFNVVIYLLACLSMIFLPGCEVIGGIFKAGVWSGVIIVVLVLALIVFVISRLTKKD